MGGGVGGGAEEEEGGGNVKANNCALEDTPRGVSLDSVVPHSTHARLSCL